MKISKEVDHLRAEVRRLRRALSQRPVKSPKFGNPQIHVLKIIDGNTVFNSGGVTLYGISRVSSIATVPSLYDPNSVGGTPGLFTAIAGIGRATLYTNGVLQSGYVLVALTAASPITTALVENDIAQTVTAISIPLASDATQFVTAYVPVFV